MLLAGLVIWWLVGAVRAPGETREIAVSADESSIVDIVPPASETQSPNPVELPAVERPWEELPATAVINSPNCLFVAGTGEAAGVAIVLAGPSPDAAWFAAVDQDGVLFGAHLEFGGDGLPLFDLGRRDGAVLMGFRTADHHAEIALDGEPIYEAEGVWSFDVASDGSSFLAIEPLAGGASRLVIRNLDLGVERHHDLGDLPIKPSIPLLYSADGTEAIVLAGTTHPGSTQWTGASRARSASPTRDPTRTPSPYRTALDSAYGG